MRSRATSGSRANRTTRPSERRRGAARARRPSTARRSRSPRSPPPLPLLVAAERPTRRGWATFGILAAGAAASHTYTVRTARDTAFHTSWVFLIPRRAAAAARARRAARRRHARARVAEGALRLVHPELQHLQLHARQPRDVGGGAPRAPRGRARSPTTTCAGRSPASPPASSPSARTTSCSRR